MPDPSPTVFLVAPAALVRAPPSARPPADYLVRPFRAGDELVYATLLDEFEAGRGRAPFVEEALRRTLPGGLFFAVHRPSGAIVGCSASLHAPLSRDLPFPFGGEVANVVTHPDHRRRGVGGALLAAAFQRLVDAGYRSIRLELQVHRLPALEMVLGLGFVPLLYPDDAEDRWRTVCANLGFPFTPARWPRAPP